MDTQKKDEKALVVLTQGQLKNLYEKVAAIEANEAVKAFRQEQKKEYSRQGIPDICAVVIGRYYGFEVKRPFIGILSKIQEHTIRQIKEAGGKAYVVTYQLQR